MKKIMIVDDEENLRELVKAIFAQENGYNVIEASSGRECLDILKTEKPDLILMDMMMPNISGREVAERIRKDPDTKNLKIAFLTVAKFSDSGKEVLKDLGVLDYIIKPFDNQDLVKRVKKIIG